MKIQFLNGGLANQAFQYIFAKFYEWTFPGQIMYMDDSYFALHTVHNGYELEKVFGIKPHFLSECFKPDVWEYILTERRAGKSIPQILSEYGVKMYMITESETYKHFNPFDGETVCIPCNKYMPEILTVPEDVYYHGYWINKNWMEPYKEYFWKEFTFPAIEDDKNKQYLEKILASHSVAVHVRRGDYKDVGILMETSRYREMIEQLHNNLEFDENLESDIKKWNAFIFSDDIEWCKENYREMGLDVFGDVIYVEGNVDGKNYIDMQLMSQCEGMIMSNSAFCYLAALLNVRRKFVVNPTERELWW